VRILPAKRKFLSTDTAERRVLGETDSGASGRGSHAAVWTHADEVNAELVSFLGKSVANQAASPSQK
jgi:hypothetical protein